MPNYGETNFLEGASRSAGPDADEVGEIRFCDRGALRKGMTVNWDSRAAGAVMMGRRGGGTVVTSGG